MPLVMKMRLVCIDNILVSCMRDRHNVQFRLKKCKTNSAITRENEYQPRAKYSLHGKTTLVPMSKVFLCLASYIYIFKASL